MSEKLCIQDGKVFRIVLSDAGVSLLPVIESKMTKAQKEWARKLLAGPVKEEPKIDGVLHITYPENVVIPMEEPVVESKPVMQPEVEAALAVEANQESAAPVSGFSRRALRNRNRNSEVVVGEGNQEEVPAAE